MAVNYTPPTSPASTGGGAQQSDTANDGKGPDTPTVGVPANLLGVMDIPQTGYFVNHEMPEDNIIFRDVPNPLFDSFDVSELNDQTIFELLPTVPTFPDTPPRELKVYVANWSRVIDFGGVTDTTKDPTGTNLLQAWTKENWAFTHKWPETSTLDPTYLFYTQDPGLFYTQRAISHYEPDADGNLRAVPVPDNDIVWKINGKEVHRGWFLNLSSMSETVTRTGTGTAEVAVAVPKTLTVEAQNAKGVMSKDIKYAVIDSDAAALLGGTSTVDNYTSTYEGVYVPDESDGTKGIIFQEDPRYGPRDFYVRFKWNNFGNGKSKRRKFKKSTAKFIVDGQVIETLKGTDVYDKWQPITDYLNLRHQDALGDFPDAFEPFSTDNDTLVVKEEYRDKGGAQLGDINVTDWTNGRKSAIFTHEPTAGQSKLFKFSKKPGPFTLFMGTDFRVRLPGQGRVTRFFEKEMEWTNQELNLDTPLRPIDLGVVNIDYDHRD